jgi:excisionase family DNA binding protein
MKDHEDSDKKGLLGNDSAIRALRPPEWTAEFLATDVEWVNEAAANGEIPSIPVGSHVRFDPIAIKQWVRSRSGVANDDLPAGAEAQLSKAIRALRTEVRGIAASGDVAISVEEAARRLGCGRTTVFELLKEGRLRRAKSLGRRTMLLASAVAKLGTHPTQGRPPRADPAVRVEAAIRGLKI